MELTHFLRSPGEWLRGAGPHPDIVISSRTRLARNLACYRFACRIGPEEKAEVAHVIRKAIQDSPNGRDLTYFDLETLNDLDRQFLHERHLISRELLNAEGPRGAAIDAGEMISIMVNEEDHLRLQSLRCGLQLEDCFAVANRLDNELAERLDYAFDVDFGYLTACPTNLGTGLRVSVMLHLPALVMTRHIEKAFRAVQDMKLAVRGLYGEGTEAHGEFYQISNQITIGRTEEEIVADLRAFIDGIISYEARARERLLQVEPAKLEDRVWRAYGTLVNARIMSSEEAMRHLSSVRLGIHLGLLPALQRSTLNTTFLLVQPAHLQRLEGRELAPEERDISRANYIRSQIQAAKN